MPFEKTVEAIIQEAMARGEFDNLSGAGKPIDLSAYFDTPEEQRAAYSLLKNAGMAPREVELLQEIAELREIAAALRDEEKRKALRPCCNSQGLRKQIEQKQIEFNLMIERNHRQSKKG